jgi:hypothetical protein
MLSATAPAFVPAYCNLDLLTADGSPSAVFYSPPSSPVRRGSSVELLSDECIEELFPPSDEELHELEIVDQYVELLAYLDMLEEQEAFLPEEFLEANFQKRWESRRREFNGRRKDTTGKYAGKPHAVGSSVINVVELDVKKPLPRKGHRSSLEQKLIDKGNAYRNARKNSGKSTMRQPMPRFVQAGLAVR